MSFVLSAVIWWEVCFMECIVSVNMFGVWFECGSVMVSWGLCYDMRTAQM